MEQQQTSSLNAAAAIERSPFAECPLTAALLRARKSLDGVVFKGGYAQHQKYSYVGHEDVIRYARAALLAEGITLTESSVALEREVTWTSTDRNGEVKQHVAWLWTGVFELVHTSGRGRELRFSAMTLPNDKAAFVASTALDRTAIMRVLQLAGTDQEDPEHDSNNQAEQPARQEQQQPAGSPVQDFAAELGALQDVADIQRWLRDFRALRVDKNAKQPGWRAYETRCKQLGLDPAELAGVGRAQ